MKVIIAGSREFTDYERLKQAMDTILSQTTEPIEVVCGMARGADLLGKRYGEEKGYPVIKMPAQWRKKDGSKDKFAGYRRNREMAKVATHLVAFWNGYSTGTRDMINVMNQQGKPVRIVEVKC